jgi:hypothetical protein
VCVCLEKSISDLRFGDTTDMSEGRATCPVPYRKPVKKISLMRSCIERTHYYVLEYKLAIVVLGNS